MANKREQSSTEKRRTISEALSPVIEYLELKGDRTVLLDDIRDQLKGSSDSTIRWMVRELVQRGWLEPLAVKGAYEFIPGAAAGKYSSGDPWLDLKAAQKAHPNLDVQVGFSSAAWLRGFLERAPSTHTIVVAREPKPPPSLSEVYRVVRTSTDKIFGSDRENGIRISDIERIFVEVAWRPDVMDMRSDIKWLKSLIGELRPEKVIWYLKRLRIKSVWARAGYLSELLGSDSLARHIEDDLPESKGPYYWGDAGRKDEYVARWKLYDNVGLGRLFSDKTYDL